MIPIVKLIQELSLQITGIGRTSFGVENCWHLVKEDLVGRLLSLIHLVGCSIEKIAVLEEFTGKTSKHENVLIISLNDTASLSIWEVLLRHVDQGPLTPVLVVESFDRVYVFAGLVGDTAEDVHISVTESTGAMIVSTNIEVCDFKPQVNITVVHLTFELRLIFFFSGASNNDKLFSEPTAGVTMSWVLHLISLHELVILARNNLKKIVQGLIVFLVIATSYKVKLTKRAVDTLKIMWELVLLVNSDNLRKLIVKLNLENLLRIFLHKMDSAKRWPFVQVGCWDHLLVSIRGRIVVGETLHN